MDETALRAFFANVEPGRGGLLFLDYDGTLAPFCEDRDRAIPYEGVLPRIRRIVDGGGRVVLVSGRPVAVVHDFVERLPVEIFGCHGMERLTPGGRLERAELPPSVRRVLDRAEKWVRSMEIDRHIEVKPTSVALHVRGLPVATGRALTRSVRACWETLFDDDDPLEIHAFDGGIEVRPTTLDKGDAVRRVLDTVDDAPVIAYLGDDATDEDAFEALEGRALRLLVREEPRPSLADGWVVPPLQLLQFLDMWAETFGSSSQPSETVAKP